MILHHYDISPFSEKIRLMFGHTGLDWQSMKVPPVPPRRTLDPLTGGYRRIPVAQIGADLFCDTKLIADEIAALTDQPKLAFHGQSSLIQKFVLETNGSVFMAVAQSVHPKTALVMMLKHHWPWQIMRLLADRAGVAKSSSMPRTTRSQREALILSFKEDLEARLASTPYTFGDSPSIADFAAYHVVWFANLTQPNAVLSGFPKALAWQKRMSDFGHGASVKLNRKQIFDVARTNPPRALDDQQQQHDWLGRTVVVKPDDYAKDAVEGRLVGADQSRWILARETSDCGTVHVHFPKIGYEITTK